MGEIQNDHDLLIILNSKMTDLIKGIEDLKAGVNKKIDDHEARLRLLEKESEDHILVKKVVYGAVAFVLLSVLSAIVYLVVKTH